jgi:hypothetical protein
LPPMNDFALLFALGRYKPLSSYSDFHVFLALYAGFSKIPPP